jgi:putative membrane protein
MMGFGFGFGGTWLGALLMLLFWVGVILMVIWAIRALFPAQRQSERDVALEVLRRRYAAGEISAAEYEQALRTLGGPEAHA